MDKVENVKVEQMTDQASEQTSEQVVEQTVEQGANEDKNLPKLTKSDVSRAYWNWQFFSHANYNYERLQGSSFAASMTPIIKKLYPNNKEKQSELLKRHLTFFNTEPNFGTVIHGIVIAMEEQIARGADISAEAINSIKAGLMGPLAGLGDTLTQGTIIPLLLALGISFGKEGNLFGPLFFIIACCGTLMFIARTCWMRGYHLGKDAVTSLLGNDRFQSVISAAGILGVIVIGALIAQFVNLNLAVNVNIGDTMVNLQADVLDKMMPKLLPLGLTILMYKLLQKQKSPVMLMVAIIVSAVVGAYLGIW